jgi:putative tryptophan/tyrosine transport system substrate-binding protein
MRRREFIRLIGGAATMWPLEVLARQPISTMPVIGFLHPGGPEESASRLQAFRIGLRDAGYDEGRNLTIEYRWAKGDYSRLPGMAAELVHLPVRVLVAATTPSAVAAKAATTNIPVVFTTGSDPVQLGLVASLNRPGGNVTGAMILAVLLAGKQFEILHELVPHATIIGFLVNPKNAYAQSAIKDAIQGAEALRQKLIIIKASTAEEIEAAFTTLSEQHVEALVVDADPFILSLRERVVALAQQHSMPAMYAFREYVTAGGLVSYSPSLVGAYHLAGVYVGRILNGETPANLPVVEPTKFDFAINLKTAKALGITVPQTLLVAADEVIE